VVMKSMATIDAAGHNSRVPGGPAQGTGETNFGRGRLGREWKTVAAMVRCYCSARHGVATGLCPECQGLLDYATVRLERCRFGPDKPTCARCPVHCYQRQRREQIRVVMRYAGPRLLWRYPWLSLRHWLDSFRTVPSVVVGGPEASRPPDSQS
jgi:hypothetical protein